MMLYTKFTRSYPLVSSVFCSILRIKRHPDLFYSFDAIKLLFRCRNSFDNSTLPVSPRINCLRQLAKVF